MMRVVTISIIIFSALYATFAVSETFIVRTKNKIVFGKSGNPKKEGFWEVNQKGKAIRFLGEPDLDLDLAHVGDEWILKKKKFSLLQSENAPFGEAVPQMTPQGCGRIDLSKNSGPVRNQIGQTCYAYVANDLLSFDQAIQYSPLYLSEQVKFKVDAGGDPRDALYSADGFNSYSLYEALLVGINQGLCPESSLPSSLHRDETTEENYRLILQYYKKLKNKLADLDCEETELIFKKDFQVIFPHLTFKDFKRTLIESTDATDFLRKMSSITCEKNLDKTPVRGLSEKNIKLTTILRSRVSEAEGFYPEDKEKLMTHLNEALEKGRPAAVYYKTSGVLDYSHHLMGGPHSSHTSLVLGRYWREEEKDSKGKVKQMAGCYYLVKNSWGETWKAPEGVSARNVSGKPGYFLMSEKTFLEHAFTAISLN